MFQNCCELWVLNFEFLSFSSLFILNDDDGWMLNHTVTHGKCCEAWAMMTIIQKWLCSQFKYRFLAEFIWLFLITNMNLSEKTLGFMENLFFHLFLEPIYLFSFLFGIIFFFYISFHFISFPIPHHVTEHIE